MNVSQSLNAPSSASTGSTSGKSQTSKIHDASQQFEAMMIGEMLKSARENGSWDLSEDGESDPGKDSLSGMAEQQFALALAKSGGLGLSHMVEQGVSKQAGPQKDDPSQQTSSSAPAK